MIIYRPSAGNKTTPVDVNNMGYWIGEPLGAELIKEKSLRVFPYSKIDSKLISTANVDQTQQSSKWIYKNITDFDFIKSTSSYRCIYIGCEVDGGQQMDNFYEYIDTISANVTHTAPSKYPSSMSLAQATSYLDNTVNIQMWYEGKYNIVTSKNSFVANDEMDKDGALEAFVFSSGRPWQSSIYFNEYLKPGEYLKIWIKIDCVKDRSLLDFDGYSYTYAVNDLVISGIEKVAGRLNVSKVYSGPLNKNKEVDVTELLSLQVKYNEIIKIVENQNLTNVFYLDESNKIHDLIIKNYGGISQNKFIDYDFSALTEAISSNANYAFARVVECLNGNIQYFGEIKNELRPFIDKRFIIDIIPSNKESRNECYIFFNELKASTEANYETKYNHIHYSWNFGVIRLDLSFSNEREFEEIIAGFENKKDISILDLTGLYVLKNDFFASSVILQDDLFTIVGYEIEDCKLDSKKCFINYLWEKDIIKNNPSLTTSLVPKTKSTELLTVKNEGFGDAYLVFNDISKIDTESFESLRTVKKLNDGKSYIQLSSPHEKEIQIGTSSLSCDIAETIDNISYTLAFNVNEASIQTNVNKTVYGKTVFNDDYAPHKHLMLDKVYRDYTEFKKVYTPEQRSYYNVQQIRQDGMLIENINPPSYVVALTGNQHTIDQNYSHLQEILPPNDILVNSVDFGRIVKLSGDGNTAIIVIKDYAELTSFGYPLYNVKTSKVVVYKRSGMQWKFVRDITPLAHDKFILGVFLQILDEEKIDINFDGSKIIISSVAKTGELSLTLPLGDQFDYDGYVVRVYSTDNDWVSYSQQVIQATDILPKGQKEFLISKDSFSNNVYRYDFGYSVSISNCGDYILVGSPSEYYHYENKDSLGTILDEFDLVDNGAAYLLTTNKLTPATVAQVDSLIGTKITDPNWNPFLDLNQDEVIDERDRDLAYLAYPAREYTYGDNISGSNWNLILRLTPFDSRNMQVGGISYKECLANGFRGKRYGEKVRLSGDAVQFSISAKYDCQQFLLGGSVYQYQLLTTNNGCLIPSPLRVIKVYPNTATSKFMFSNYSIDLSRDGSTLAVGCANENGAAGSVHIFNNFNWEAVSQYPYTEVVVTDPDATTNGNFGLGVKLNNSANILLVKNSNYVKQFDGTSFVYSRKYTEFNKIPLSTQESGESLDMSDDGYTIAFGCVRNELVEENRVFIFDEYPYVKSSLTFVCPTSGTTGTTGTTGTSGTSGSPMPPIIISDLYSIPIYYLIEVNYIPVYYTVQVLTDELQPLTIIGKEKQAKEFIDETKGIVRLHCNGNPEVYALDVGYNFKQQEWTLNYFNNKAQQITIIIADSGIELSPNYTNVITVNTTRKQVNGYYCGKRYVINYEICVNGRSLFKDASYTFDTTNTYVITYNQNNNISSSVTYVEVRDYIDSVEIYNKAMSSIFSNVYWATLEQQQENTYSQRGFEHFVYKRLISFNNLPFNIKGTIVLPIVLQGNGYNVDAKYNAQVKRNIFNFSVIDVANPSFGFSYEGGAKPLSWSIDSYDINKDMLVIWVKLEDWDGQRLLFYYSDLTYINDAVKKNPFDGHIAAWKMDKLSNINRLRYDTTMVYNGGEAIIVSQNNDKNFITQIDKAYMIGNLELYKSNKFDVYYDDSGVVRSREDKVKQFIKDNVKLFAPGFMEIRDIKPMDELLVESNSTVGEDNGI